MVGTKSRAAIASHLIWRHLFIESRSEKVETNNLTDYRSRHGN